MSTEAERFNERLRQTAAGKGRTVVYKDEVLRHSTYTRAIHWAVAIFFILTLLSGLAIFTPWLYAWITPIFGSGPRTRLLHPWFGLGFVITFVLMMLNWIKPMNWDENDRKWLDHLRGYITNQEEMEPEYVGKFNAGQKLWFWSIVGTSVVFLITGIIMWWPEVFGRLLMWISYFLHDIAALVMLGGFIVHIYEGTTAIPGTFHSMINGTVSKAWAWTHHPAWYREATGRDPREDYERENRRLAERRRVNELTEHEQDHNESSEH
jgi:formate dehydrogenase subunit gamma